VLAIASLTACASQRGASVGVGPGTGQQTILAAIEGYGQIKAVRFGELSIAALQDCDAVVWPVGRLSANERERRLLRDYVSNGGGLVLVRDPDFPFCDAMRDSPPFPEVAGLLPRIWRYDRALIRGVVDPDHPLGKALPMRLELPPYDHLILDPGPNGTILMLSEDADTVMVAGTLGKGRVVIMGYLPGYRKFADDSRPTPGEWAMVTESLKWTTASK